MKTFKGVVSLLVVGSIFVGNMAFASKTKRARSNDVAAEYILEDDGDFFRTVNGNKCQITNRVTDFKISQHPKDAAMVYFIKDYSLYVLHNGESFGQCPKASTKVIMDSVEKYNVVSNTNTLIVNTALNRYGTFAAWDNYRMAFQADRVSDYVLNECFGAKGKSFSSYVAFLISRAGYVTKVKGNEPQSAKEDNSQSYYDLKDFKERNRVCQAQSQAE